MHAVAPSALSADPAATLPRFERPPIPAVVQQHADDAAHLRHVRSVLVRAPHVKLLHLKRLDDRLEAHLDGLAVAGSCGQQRAEAALERLGCGEVFAAVVCALQAQDDAVLQRLLSLALAWVTPGLLRDVVRRMLVSQPPWQRALGLDACRLHRVDPGPALGRTPEQEDALLRAASLRTAGELGCTDLLPQVTAAIAVQALDWERARKQVRTLAQEPSAARALIRAIGWLGDARLVPWLIERMADLKLSRDGTQRQRALAAQQLCLLQPGRALFPVAAPVWRQQRQLAES